ncbi:MAG TPA: glycine betaine ABC transporter substrate-binding protein [Bryobacteraceae bacterium]|jgi:glycine betaine/choline ABC-type transport system substrate-binding protein
MGGTKILAASLTALAAVLGLGGCQSGPRIVVGSKNFAEQLLLGEIAAQQIERRLHVTVERKLQIGGTLLAHEALVKGDIDLYPEYTGTALTAVLKQITNDDPAMTLAEVRSGYRQWKLRWMDPLGFDNTFAMVIRRSDAERHHIQTLSEAGAYPPGWKLGAGYEFVQRQDGLPGLKRTYGLRLNEVRTMDLGLLYSALEQQQVDLAAANSTDGQLSSNQFTALADDKHYFPPYQAAFVVREESLTKYPGLEGALKELSGKLTTESMRQLNYEVQVQHRPGPKIVAEWLEKLK